MYERLRGAAYHFSATNQVLLILSAGVVAAVACSAAACAARNSCVDAGSCVQSTVGVCAFRNRAFAAIPLELDLLTSVAADAVNASSDALALLLRGACAPGERQQRSALTGTLECASHYPFPDSTNYEITDPAAAQPHRQACGRWIDAGGYVDDVEYFAMNEHAAWVAAMEQAENVSTLSARTASTQAAKLRAECDSTVQAGPAAMRAAGALAYRRLADRVERVATRGELLRASGFLSSHYCDNSVRVGSLLSVDGKFVLELRDGWTPAPGVLAEALHVAGEPEATQRKAEAARAEVQRLANSHETPALSAEDVAELMRGALDREALGSYRSSPETHTNLLSSLVAYFEAGNVDGARSYLRGIAAFCSVELMVSVGGGGHLAAAELRRIRGSHPPAAALGRLRTEEREVELTNDAIFEAGSVTIGQLQGGTGDAGVNCLNLMRGIFPDDVDEMRFQATMEEHFYERLEPLVAAVRGSMASVWGMPPLNLVVENPWLVAADVRAAGIRVAGAPRGSWAGIARPISRGAWTSGDGLFVAALKQTRAMFFDRIGDLVFGDADPCDHPPFLESTTLNAYMIPSVRCSMLLLGMSHRPYLDEQYNDASLASGGLFIVAHELGHLSINSPRAGFYTTLLAPYRGIALSEAIADVSAAFGILHTGLVDPESFMLKHCQLWCGRVPPGFSPSSSASHPAVNDRCDHLRDVLLPYFLFDQAEA